MTDSKENNRILAESLLSEAKKLEAHLLTCVSRQAVIDQVKKDHDYKLEYYDSYVKIVEQQYKRSLQTIKEYPSRKTVFENNINFLTSKKEDVKSAWLKEKIQNRIDNQETNLSFLEQEFLNAKKVISEYKVPTIEEYEKLISPTLNEQLTYVEKYLSGKIWKTQKEKNIKELSEVQTAIEELKSLDK